mmetsp:Transcript_21104/g.50075  ORF Transcript_21104/g.50075 Transcript_21104/m.50075 type:complete len:210 (-) Transcript_21104:228-857(-)
MGHVCVFPARWPCSLWWHGQQDLSLVARWRAMRRSYRALWEHLVPWCRRHGQDRGQLELRRHPHHLGPRKEENIVDAQGAQGTRAGVQLGRHWGRPQRRSGRSSHALGSQCRPTFPCSPWTRRSRDSSKLDQRNAGGYRGAGRSCSYLGHSNGDMLSQHLGSHLGARVWCRRGHTGRSRRSSGVHGSRLHHQRSGRSCWVCASVCDWRP